MCDSYTSNPASSFARQTKSMRFPAKQVYLYTVDGDDIKGTVLLPGCHASQHRWPGSFLEGVQAAEVCNNCCMSAPVAPAFWGLASTHILDRVYPKP